MKHLEVQRSRDRNCGPTAVARITGWPIDRVVMHIRALRERSGRRLSLRGGTQPSEYTDALRVAGWVVEPERVRAKLRDLGKGEASTWWLCYQPRHVFAWRRKDDRHRLVWCGDVTVTAHRVRRVRRNESPVTDSGIQPACPETNPV